MRDVRAQVRKSGHHTRYEAGSECVKIAFIVLVLGNPLWWWEQDMQDICIHLT